ncbi:hypothetical protein [Micromonospora sp. RP3T]|uniref:hypothetical protein n=1 Tax=Micromonospora sp. RP3T TaxID=2135446 RepID=UPI003D73C024
MAVRHPFGGSAEDWIFAEDENNVPVLQGGAVLTFWNQREEGGTQYTDIAQDSDGATPIVELKTSLGGDGYRIGQIPVFFGPPDVTTMWVSADGGERVAIDALDAGDLGAAALAALAQHTGGGPNPHSTGLANLSDVEAGTLAARVSGQVVGWDGARFTLLTPAQVSGALLLNPPLSGGAYVGNIVQPPPSTQSQPWLQMRQPYSAADSNPDSIQLFATHTNNTTPVKTFWTNGNNEARGAPSTVGRIGGRWFEFYEALGGPSTGRFFELSTNPTIAANREPLLGAYGTGHPTWPGWMVATRVFAGLLGVRAGGGNYNGLGAVIFRGVRATTGPPTSGTYATNDAVLDAAGALYLCTAGGTPGTWSTGASGGGGSAPSSFVDVTPGTNMAHGTKHAATRLERGGDATRLRGTLSASASIAAGAVLGNIATTGHRPLAEVSTIARYTGGGAKITITTGGNITLGSPLTSGQEVWLDSITWDLVA